MNSNWGWRISAETTNYNYSAHFEIDRSFFYALHIGVTALESLVFSDVPAAGLNCNRLSFVKVVAQVLAQKTLLIFKQIENKSFNFFTVVWNLDPMGARHVAKINNLVNLCSSNFSSESCRQTDWNDFRSFEFNECSANPRKTLEFN